MSLRIAILYGSMREARNGIRVVRFLDAALRRRGHATSIVDAAKQRLPLLDRMYKEYERGSAPPVLEALAELYRKVDAFAIASAIICYSAGQFGGVRAAMQLRMTLAELGMPSIPSLLPVPHVQDALTPAGEPTDPAIERRSERFFVEFEWYAWRSSGRPRQKWRTLSTST